MINLTLPSVSIERVSNGYVVTWRKKNPHYPERTSERTVQEAAVALTDKALLDMIKRATADIEAVNQPDPPREKK